MTRQMTRTAALTAAFATFQLALPAPARAQTPRVQVDVKLSGDISREIRDALREVTNGLREAGSGLREATSGLNDAMRDVSRELGRELGRDLGRDLGNLGRDIAAGLRDLPDLGHLGAWDGGWTDAQERNWRGEATDRQTRPLAIGANGAIDVRNLSGDITVTAGNGRDASIELIRRSRGRTEADARVGLDRVKVDVQVSGARATVKTDYPNERQSNYSVSVDMIVTAPVGTRITVNSVSADVKVSGVRGEVSVTTISGDVVITNVGAVSEAKTASGDVTITGSTGDIALDCGTLSGDVTLKQVKARRISASTVSGSVTAHDVAADSASLNTMSGDAIYVGDLARNGRYELTSHSGDVQFTPSGAVGFTLSASSFGGDISSSLALQTDGSRTRRRSLSGKVGDGSATVTLKTFNGDITVGGRK